MKPSKYRKHSRSAWRAPFVVAALAVLPSLVRCSSDEVVIGAEGDKCAEEEKFCDGACRSKTNPEYGCAGSVDGQPTCGPCSLANGSAICDEAGACDIAFCLRGYASCNGLAFDGCEVDLNSNPNYCGSCNADPCEIANAEPDCVRGRCTIGRCLDGYRDCNRGGADGCEIDVQNDVDNCGGCTDLDEPDSDFRCAEGEQCVEAECEPE
jgi:hypothetical protein